MQLNYIEPFNKIKSIRQKRPTRFYVLSDKAERKGKEKIKKGSKAKEKDNYNLDKTASLYN